MGSGPGANTGTGIFPYAAVDPAGFKIVQVPGQRKHDRTLRHELDHNPRAAPFEGVAVFDESRQGKSSVAEVWHVRNITCARPFPDRRAKLISSYPSIERVEPSAMRSFKFHFL